MSEVDNLEDAVRRLVKSTASVPLTIEQIRDALSPFYPTIGGECFRIATNLVGARGLSPEFVAVLECLWQEGPTHGDLSFHFTGCSKCDSGEEEHFIGPVNLQWASVTSSTPTP